MTLPAKTRKSPHEIILGSEVVVRFTFCAIEAEARNPRNEMTMYLYNAKLKKRIGKLIHYRYNYSKMELKEIQKNRQTSSKTPLKARTPSTHDVVNAVCKLLRNNADLPLVHQKGSAEREKAVTLDSSNFAICYLHHFNEINQKYWSTEEARKEAQRCLVHMMIAFGNIDFAPIANKDTSKQFFEFLRNQISCVVGNGVCEKKSIELLRQCLGEKVVEKKLRRMKRADDLVTGQMKLYSNTLWCVIESYLLEKKVVEYRSIKASYSSNFHKKIAPENAMRRNLTQKTLSNVENTDLANAILEAAISNDMKVALLMIFFMGITAEEVCAVNQKDVKPMEYYAARYISVYQEYSVARVKEGKQGKRGGKEKYKMTDNLSKEQYRNIPIPDFIFSKLPQGSPIENEDKPLLSTLHGKRLCPKDLTCEASDILKKSAWNEEVLLTSSIEDGRDICLDFKFSYYKSNLRYLWASFGLQDAEIRYLVGDKQTDTAGKYYIDFNNPNKQYSMFTQMNNALNTIVKTPASAEKSSGELKNARGHRSATLSSAGDEVCHTRIRVTQPCVLTVKNKHGFNLIKRGE